MKIKWRVWWMIALAGGIGLVVALSIFFHQPAPAPLSMVIAHFATHSGLLHIAEAKGYFAAANLKVTFKTIKTGHEAIAQVLQGAADVGTTAETPVAKVLAEGKQLRIIAQIYSSRRNSGIVVRKDHGLHQPADLKGKRIGVPFGTGVHYQLESFLAFHAIPLDAVTLVPGAPDQLVAAITAGEIDAASTWEPWLSHSMQKLGSNAQTFFSSEIYSQTGVLVVRPEYVAQHRDAIDRLLWALHQAEIFFVSHPDEASAIIASAAGMDALTLRRRGKTLTYELSLRQALLQATENEVSWFFRRKLVPAGPMPDVLQAFETAPLRALKPDSVTISK